MMPETTGPLEEELLLRHRELYGGRSQVSTGRRRVLLRPAYVALTLVMVIIGIGAIPAGYPIVVGRLVELTVDGQGSRLFGPGDLLSFLIETGAAEEISVSIQEGDHTRVHLVLIGEVLSEGDLIARLGNRYPALRGARIRSEALRGTIRASLVERIGRALFSLEISAADVEAARRQILSEFTARGYRGTRVEVQKEGDRSHIEIELGDQD